MGRATVLLFAQHGWFVGAYDLDVEGLASLKAEIGDGHGVFARLDVTDQPASRPPPAARWT